MFNVIHKESKNIYTVYDVLYDASGYPHFIIYKDDQWLRISAKRFKPVDTGKISNEVNTSDTEEDHTSGTSIPEHFDGQYHEELCISCGQPIIEGMVCQRCIDNDGPTEIPLNNIHIANSYKIWSTITMCYTIMLQCMEQYQTIFANTTLNRSYFSMYFEWYLHNIGYWLTLPFCKIKKFKALNERFKHVDLEEHT